MAVRDDRYEAMRAAEHRRKRRWYVLLVVPFVALLYPPVYAREDPQLFGFPFFYWYQFAWVLITVTLTVIVYRATRGSER